MTDTVHAGGTDDSTEAVFSAFGQVAFAIQGLERILSIVLGMVYSRGPVKITRTQAKTRVESYFAETLGQLRTALSAQREVPEDLRRLLDTALAKRNWLTHHYFWDRQADLLSSTGRARMVAELADLHGLFDRLALRLAGVYADWLAANGVARADIEAAMPSLKLSRVG